MLLKEFLIKYPFIIKDYKSSETNELASQKFAEKVLEEHVPGIIPRVGITLPVEFEPYASLEQIEHSIKVELVDHPDYERIKIDWNSVTDKPRN